METVRPFIDRLLDNLCLLEGSWRLIDSPLKDRIWTLIKDLRFLSTFINYSAKAIIIPSGGSSSIVNNFEAAMGKLEKELSPFSRFPGINAVDVADKVDPIVSSMLEEVIFFKPQIREASSMLLKQQSLESKSSPVDPEYLWDFLTSVLENLDTILLSSKSLTSVLKEKFECLKQKLRFLESLIPSNAGTSVLPEFVEAFLNHVHTMTTYAACLSCCCWVDEKVSPEMDMKLSDLLLKIKPRTSHDIEMYFALLKDPDRRLMDFGPRARRARSAGKFADFWLPEEKKIANFVEFLLGNTLDSNKGPIHSLQQELECLVRFIMDQPNNFKGDLFRIPYDIKAALLKAVSFCAEEDVALTENKLSNLFKEIQLLKARVFLKQIGSNKEVSKVSMMEIFPVFLETFSFDLPEKTQDEEKLLLLNAETVSTEVRSLIYSIRKVELTNEIVMKMKPSLSWLLPKIYLINTEIKLIELLSCSADLFSPVLDQVEFLREELRFLRTFLIDTRDIEDQNLLLTHLEAVDSQSLSLISSFLYDDCATKSSLSLPMLLGHIKLIKAEIILAKLEAHNVGLMVHMKSQVKRLYQELGFLMTFLFDPSWMYEEKVGLILTKAEAMANEAASLIFTIHDDKIKEDMGIELAKLIDKMVLLKSKIREIYLQIPESLHSKLPMTNALISVSSSLGNMRELLDCDPSSIFSVKHLIEMLYSEFGFLKGFLRDTTEQHSDDEEVKDLWTHITHLVYEAEYMIDLFVAKESPSWHFMLWFYFAMEDIAFARGKVEEMYKENKFDTGFPSVSHTSIHVPSKGHRQAFDHIFVGFEDEMQKLIDCLTRGTKELEVISIVGMLGIGKTTLAKEVYNCPSIAKTFHIRAWCSLSQAYDLREVLLNILGDTEQITGSIHEMENDELQERLYKCLKGKKYLVIFDGLKDTRSWQDLKESFPNDHNGSRVLVICKLSNVDFQANTVDVIFPLRQFSDLESWNFLEKTVFYQVACPPELQKVGAEILSYCRGLPIAISVIGGLLANTESNLDWWNQVAKSLRYGNFIADPYMHVLEFCYEQLPSHLKPCFLYFAAFPEGKEIPVWKLFSLWIAEGFVQKIESKMLEDVAEEYLLDLINRNLVIVAKRRSDGGVKACLLHDLLRDLCTAKAKEENFMHWIQQCDEHSTRPVELHYDADSDYSYLSNPPEYDYEYCRLCINSSAQNHFVMQKPSGPCVRCLLCFASNDASPRPLSDISFICQNFQLLTILDLQVIPVGYSFLAKLEKLVLLRYLALRPDISFVPSSIANLVKLETFILMINEDVRLPNAFWSMRRLRHVRIKGHVDALSFRNFQLENSFPLDNMYTLSCLVLCCGKHTEMIFISLPKLRKLKCIFRYSRGSSTGCDGVPHFELLTNLESLNVDYLGPEWIPCRFEFPSNLRKLTLSKCYLTGSTLPKIGVLPNLEVLKLLDTVFQGETWMIREGEFLKLKYLKLNTWDMVQWKAEDYSLCCLEQVVLRSCGQLEKVPSSFGGIPTLQSLELHRCRCSAAESAKEILMEQQRMGNDKLKIHIYP